MVPIRAAQYLRTSTADRQYMSHQRFTIRQYAERHGLVLVRSYVDAGKRGVTLKGRIGLAELLRDVVQGRADYQVILVYDVSRWGRFQDTDEAAHCEFLCKSAGIRVLYCTEPYLNDLSVSGGILKALKRGMAGEYSRHLAVVVSQGKRRLVQLGYWVGGQPGFGLRRMLVSRNGARKRELESREQKTLHSDRIILVPGPQAEVECVRNIFCMADKGQSPAQIARFLNERGMKYRTGAPWTPGVVLSMLKHSKYAGCSVWGRTTQKMGSAARRTPRHQWIIQPHSFESIIDQGTFDRVQNFLRDRTASKPDEHYLAPLRELLEGTGKLSHSLVVHTKNLPCISAYYLRFGSPGKAYEKVGFFQSSSTLSRIESMKRVKRQEVTLVQELTGLFPDRVSVFRPKLTMRPLLVIDGSADVAISVCRPRTPLRGVPRWLFSVGTGRCDRPILLCLPDPVRRELLSFYLMPTLARPTWKYKNLRQPCDPWLAQGVRLDGLASFFAAAKQLGMTG